MKPELEQRLFDKYPELFSRYTLPMAQTCMCWGIETGDGWYDIIDDMCEEIARTDPECKLEQVKEKFGTLRVYTLSYTKESDKAIRKAELRSAETCETCGEPGGQRGGGWVRTLCTRCLEG